MTLPSRPPRVHRGSALPPGVPPPKKGELHLRVEGFDWQNMAFEARPPACCSLLISWWGQANYNSLLMPLSTSLAFSPAIAIFSVHSSAKRFERYLQDMGFLELTLVNGNTTFDLKDVSRTMLGKISVTVSNLAEGHPICGSYPIFANGHRLIGSLTLGITITFYNHTVDEDVGQPAVKSSRYQTTPRCENAKPHMVSSFERNEELASMENTLPLYPLSSCVGPCQEPMWRDVNFNSYSSLNSERSFGLSINEDVKLAKYSLKELKSSIFDEIAEKIVNKQFSDTKSSSSSESKLTLSTIPDVDSSPFHRDNETNEAHFHPANPYLDPSFCELDELEVVKADSLCTSGESNLSCVISKSACLTKSLDCESARDLSVKSTDLFCDEMAKKDSNRLQDVGRKGCHGTINSIIENDHNFPTKPRKDILKVDKLNNYALLHELHARDDTDAYNSYEKQSSDLSTFKRIRNLKGFSRDSPIDALKGLEEVNSQSSLKATKFYTDEAKRGGLSDLLLPSTSSMPCSTCYTNNLFENRANPTNPNVWRRDEKEETDEVMPKGVSFIERNISNPARCVSSRTQPPFDFDPGGKCHPSMPSISTLAQTKATNLVIQMNGDQTNPTDSNNLEGRSCFSMQQSFQPKASIVIESGNKKLCSPCSNPQTVIDNIKQLIKRAEACRDTLKKPDFPKMTLMASSPIPSAESICLSRSLSGHSFGVNSSSDDLLANILGANDKGHDSELSTKVHKHVEDLNLAEDVDDATDVMTATLLEALYIDNDKTANVSSTMAIEPALCKTRHHEAETCRIERYRQDDYFQSRDNGSKNPMYWPEEDILNVTKCDGMSFDDRILAQGVAYPGSKQDQSLSLRVTLGKLVLCGPIVRDLADCRPSKRPLMHPTCTCSLTVSFPSLIPPYSSKQRICISPISFGTREAVFDHQSQLSWNTLPGHDLQEWQSRGLRVVVLLTWQHFDTMECVGYISLEKVVTSMPDIYRTSLALVLTSHLEQKRNRPRSPSKRLSPKKPGKQTLKPGLKHPTGATRRNSSENLEILTSTQKDAIARVDVALQLCHGKPLPAIKHESFEETQTKGQSRINGMKSEPRRVLTNSAPVLGNLQDWWLHVVVHDVVNCFENILNFSQYSSNIKVRAPHLLLVVKSGPKQIVQVPFPQKVGLGIQILGNSTDGILPAPAQLLKTNKAVMFIEVWYDAGVANNIDSTQKLVGLIKAPLTLASGIVSPTDCHYICAKGLEVVAQGLHQMFDPLQCTTVGMVMIMVTLGSSHQMLRLWKENKAATLIQRRVREFLTRELGPDKSIEITRFWDTTKNPRAS